MSDEKKVELEVRLGLYRHKGGGRYTVIAVAQDSTNDWDYVKRLRAGTESMPGDAHDRARVIDLLSGVKFTSTQEPVVIYVSHKTGNLCVRRAAEFCEVVPWPDGTKRPRFTPEVTL